MMNLKRAFAIFALAELLACGGKGNGGNGSGGSGSGNSGGRPGSGGGSAGADRTGGTSVGTGGALNPRTGGSNMPGIGGTTGTGGGPPNTGGQGGGNSGADAGSAGGTFTDGGMPDRASGGGGAGGSGGAGGTPRPDAGSDDAQDAGGDTGRPTVPYNPCPPAGTPCTVMPLGDSITDGFTVRGGYRIPFFQRAHQDGKQFTFVGSQVNGPATVDGVAFPQQHEGHSAHTIYDAPNAPTPRLGIARYLPQVLPQYHPDILLLMIGTNDMDGSVDLPNAPERLGMLIDTIATLDPHALIVVAQITPTMQDPLNQRIVTYNAGIPAVAKARADAGRHVVLVDMYSAFTRDPAYKTKFLADRLHPNAAGYQVMSDVWNTVIHDLLH